jgi:repressor LexA
LKLTKRQEEVLSYVNSYQEKMGITPTVREICSHFGVSAPAGIHRILHVLIEKGYLVAAKGKKRAWRIPGGPVKKRIPILGRIAAGSPIMAIENREDELPVDPSAFGSESCFALRIKGDSMIDAHIMDGDIAIIQQQDCVDNGQIAAVMIEDMLDEATLKIFNKSENSTELIPANKAYNSIILNGPQQEKINILGKLTGIIRKV